MALTPTEWAETYRILTSSTSAIIGKYRISESPYLQEIFDCFCDPYIERIVFQKSSQIGYSEGLNNLVGYVAQSRPGPTLFIRPSLEDAKAYSKERLTPLIEGTPILSTLFTEVRSRRGSATTLHRVFPGGQLSLGGANSALSLKSRPIQFLLMDEVDEFPLDVQGQGDPIYLAEKRQTAFPDNRKTFLGGTPTSKATSRIAQEYENSDQRVFEITCPGCGQAHPLEWKNISWLPREPINSQEIEAVWHSCPHCSYQLQDKEKKDLLQSARWRVQKPGRRTAGFKINSLYATWVSWVSIVCQYLESRHDPKKLKAFVNTVLGEPSEEGEEIEIPTDHLLSRTEIYPYPVPEGVLFLTAGVDVQGDRLEIEVLGWGDREETWHIEYVTLEGDPAQWELWEQLADYLKSKFASKSKEFRIAAVCIDAGGHATQEVYAFCAQNAHRRWFATRGWTTPGRPVVKLKANESPKGKYHLIGTEAAKDWFFGKLGLQQTGPGFCHFPKTCDAHYFKMLISEEAQLFLHRGKMVRRYVKKTSRNEALDCRILNLAARLLLKPNLKALLSQQTQATAPEQESDQVIQPQEAKPKKSSKRARQPNSWAYGWKKK